MTSYTVKNTAGNTVATINVASTTGNSFPIELIGQGISLYGGIIAQDLYRMMENFASSTAPTNAVPGMFWYKSDEQLPYFYTGDQFVALASARSSASNGFHMLPAATGVDMTVAQTVTIFQAPGTVERFHPTGIIILPNGTPGATSPAGFNLFVSSPEDVAETLVLDNMTTNTHAYFEIAGVTRFASGADTIKLQITSPAGGGPLLVNVLLFGYVSV